MYIKYDHDFMAKYFKRTLIGSHLSALPRISVFTAKFIIHILCGKLNTFQNLIYFMVMVYNYSISAHI